MNELNNRDDNAPIILTKKCFRCSNSLVVKYMRATKTYSQKNNWEYWTENKENKDRYLCDNCLFILYKLNKDDFRLAITNPKKRHLLRYYITTGTIQKKTKKGFF